MSFNTDPVVSINNATIYQENKTILSDITLYIEKGELVFLVGRTGSGKSSLLKTLYADLSLQLGEIRIAGYDLSKIKRQEIPLLRRNLVLSSRIFSFFRIER
jgi:cell division transport system ATP-binding protein